MAAAAAVVVAVAVAVAVVVAVAVAVVVVAAAVVRRWWWVGDLGNRRHPARMRRCDSPCELERRVCMLRRHWCCPAFVCSGKIIPGGAGGGGGGLVVGA